MLQAVARRAVFAPRAIARSASTVTATPSATSQEVQLPPLNSIEASWKTLPTPEREAVFRHLVDIQKKDWKTLSNEEKRACYYVAYGPHGPREPLHAPGHGRKVFLAVCGTVGLGVGMFAVVRSMAPEPPRTMNKEWQEATNEFAKQNKMDPMTGVSSEGYKGKGFVQ